MYALITFKLILQTLHTTQHTDIHIKINKGKETMAGPASGNTSIHVNLGDLLLEQLRHRYSEDSILPFADNKFIRQYLQNRSNFTDLDLQNMVILNPNIEQLDLGYLYNKYELNRKNQNKLSKFPLIFKLPFFRKILEELDLTPTREDMEAIAAKNLKLVVVGYGGAMINFIYNLTLWGQELQYPAILNDLYIFEGDSLAFHNIPRIGKRITQTYHRAQSEDMDNHPFSENGIPVLPKADLVREEAILVKENLPMVRKNYLTAELAAIAASKGCTFIGAPTFEARAFLADKSFMFFGHGGNEVDIVARPEVDMSLGNETYGSIDIPVLLLNIHIATCAWIKMMAREDFDPLNIQPNDLLFRFNMDTYLAENPTELEVLRTYVSELNK